MALKALNLTKVIHFQSPRDPDKGGENATTFKISAIPARIYSQIKDKATKYSQDPQNPEGVTAEYLPHTIAFDVVRFGLKGMDNYVDDEGKPVDWKTEKAQIGNYRYDVVHHDVISKFDIETIRELHEAITKICEFGPETIKNSEG